MERVQGQQEQSAQAVVPSLAPFSQVPEEPAAQNLELFALTARSTPGQEGRDALLALQQALETLTPTEENGKLLVRLLDEGAFNELRADDGSPTRELAVETLLRLGYPWALQIHPDELAWYRGTEAARQRNKYLLLIGIGALAAVAEVLLFRLF